MRERTGVRRFFADISTWGSHFLGQLSPWASPRDLHIMTHKCSRGTLLRDTYTGIGILVFGYHAIDDDEEMSYYADDHLGISRRASEGVCPST